MNVLKCILVQKVGVLKIYRTLARSQNERHSTCFGRSFRPSLGVQDCTYSNQTDTAVCLLASREQYLFDKCLLLYVQSWTPNNGRKDSPKHVECHSKIKLIWYIAARDWFYYRNKAAALQARVAIYRFAWVRLMKPSKITKTHTSEHKQGAQAPVVWTPIYVSEKSEVLRENNPSGGNSTALSKRSAFF